MGKILIKFMFLLTLIYPGCCAGTDVVNYVHRILGDNPNDCGPIVGRYFKYVVSVMDAHTFNMNDAAKFGSGHMCTGVIIGSRHILTAEGCAYGSSQRIYIVAGTPVRTRNESTTQIVKVDKFVRRVPMGYAIAELHEELKLDFVSAQAIIVFPKEKSLNPGQRCHLLGWDRVEGNKCEFAKAIHNVNMTVQGESLCNDVLFKIDKTFCAVNVSKWKTRSSCLAASGRPLICDDQLAGVEVLTRSCNNERQATYFYDARFFDFTQISIPFNTWIRGNNLDKTSGQKSMSNISFLKVVVAVPFFVWYL